MVRRTPLLLAMALPGLLACPAPCPDERAPDPRCAPVEPGEVAMRNPSFEVPGNPLAGWRLVDAGGVTIETRPGVDGCTALSLVAPPEPLPRPARLITRVDAQHLRGQRVRLSLWARIDAKGERGPNLALRARGGSRSPILEMNATQMSGDHWRLHSLELDVPPDTDHLEVQVGLSRINRIDLDGVAIDRVGPACPGCEAAAPLSADQTENLVALTRLLGHVRYFHPSAEVETADWDALALVGVQAVLGATSPAELAAALERVFSPLAPTLRLGVGEPAPAPVASPDAVMIAWHHHDGKSYRRPLATIAELAAAATADDTPIPDPATPLRIDLGRGLIASLPIALPWNAAAATRAPARLDKPAEFRPDGADRVTRLAAIALLGARVAHFSPRLGRTGRPWDEVLGASFARVALARDRYGLRDEVYRLFTALHDGTAQAHLDWDARLAFQLDLSWRWVEDQLVITAADPRRTPGLQVGDVVDAIDGRRPVDALAELLPLGFGATAARRRLIAAVLLARGLAGGARILTVRHRDGSERSLRVGLHAVESVPRPPRPEAIAELADDILYVDLGHASPDDLRAAVGRLQAARAVILDARAGLAKGVLDHFRATLGDVGGDAPPDVIWPHGRHHFISPAVSTVEGPAPIELPEHIAVLIDEHTTGAVEGLADALRAQRGALLVGSPSAAAPGALSPLSLPGGLKLLMAETPHRHVSGQSEFEPLQPDIPAAPTIAAIAAGRDEPRERALAALTSLIRSRRSAGDRRP